MNMRKIKVIIYFILLFTLSSHSFALNDSAVKTKWGYVGNLGPTHWAQLNPHFAVCGTGKFQSPIDVSPKIINQMSRLEIQYTPAPVMIMKDGNTSLMIGKEPTVINDGHSIQLNFPPERTSEIITFNNQKYKLLQFHLHFPSENKFNGQSFPAEIHFVHQGENGTLVVIGVFVKKGEANPALQQILDHLPTEKGMTLQITGKTMNPISLLPNDHKHYDFQGSLTTPPCAEGVQWIVMKTPISASSEQIAKLKSATEGNNARPVQPRDKRDIFYSEE